MNFDTRNRLLGTAAIPFLLGVGLIAASCAEDTDYQRSDDATMAAACNPCAAACSAATPCGPCNPCGAAGGDSGMTECVVPRIACNPCAAKGCNPCAAAACNPCSPCGACNPCAAACNPCAAAACNPCNPCGACNPCAAAGCSPCAACNPCAAAACSPCNPCGACNPCGIGGSMKLADAEARAAYDCAKSDMLLAYRKSGLDTARRYWSWTNYATTPYESATHGGRYVSNHANTVGAAYARYEDAGTLPAGTVLAKDSFSVDKQGRVTVGPLFLMTKMAAGFNAKTLDWQYQMVMSDGSIFGTTGGAGSASVQYCADCHNVMADQDGLWLLPEQYRR